MFSGRPSVPLSVRPSVIHVVVLFPRYHQYLLTDFCQTFVTGASRDRDELIRFWGQKVKVQGHTIAAEAHSTRRRYRRVQLFLVCICILCNFTYRFHCAVTLVLTDILVGFTYISFASYCAVSRPMPDSFQPCRKCNLWQ